MKIDDKMYNEIFQEDAIREEDEAVEKPTIKINNSGFANTIFEWLNSIIIAFVVVVILLTFVFRLIDVDGTSMEPTLIDTDKVVVTNLFYTPKNGDIIVIAHGQEYEKPLVKRVIATAGQKLDIDFEKNQVYVDGVLLKEDYIQGKTIKGNSEIPSVVPEGKVFVMGDNRSVSLDSRYHEVGLIDEKTIIGRATLDIIPHSIGSDGCSHSIDFSKVKFL